MDVKRNIVEDAVKYVVPHCKHREGDPFLMKNKIKNSKEQK